VAHLDGQLSSETLLMLKVEKFLCTQYMEINIIQNRTTIDFVLENVKKK
jgi:hypothetical protein